MTITKGNMTPEERVTQIKKLNPSDADAIDMILSANADFGSPDGALVSVKKFRDVSEMILLYFGQRLTPVR